MLEKQLLLRLVSYSLAMFIKYFNKCMQQQAPLLYVFMQEIQDLVQKRLLQFMKSDYVCKLAIISEASLDNEAQYLPLDEVFIGHSTSRSVP